VKESVSPRRLKHLSTVALREEVGCSTAFVDSVRAVDYAEGDWTIDSIVPGEACQHDIDRAKRSVLAKLGSNYCLSSREGLKDS